QLLDAVPYRGQRVRLSAWIRAADAGTATLWMKTTGVDSDRALDYGRRDLHGSADWTREEIVFDVDADARVIRFGLGLTGEGQAWMDDVAFDVVDASVPATDQMPRLPATPRNLGFEE